LKILNNLDFKKAESLKYHNLGHSPKISGKATNQPEWLEYKKQKSLLGKKENAY